jgi:hypothetical protein
MIRDPDEYRTEQLNNQPHDNSLKNISYDEQISLALELSRQDYSYEMKKIEKMEEQHILEIHLNEIKNRENREKELLPILSKLKYLSKYDKEVISILSILEDIFQQYINGNNYCLEEESKIYVWKILNQIRFNVNEKSILYKIIQ